MDDADRSARIADPQIRRFVEYWRSKCCDAKYPARAALDPLDFRYVLGDVVLIEVSKAVEASPLPWNFRYRLVGSNVAARDGYDLTHKTLEDLPEPEYRERVRATWTEVCETGDWSHHIRELVLDRRLRCYEVVVMPLASNGQDIDMLISVQRETPPDWKAAHP
ncbi:MAG TPA: PAS domain-containing protein [Stellaceae bacterium]|nr:PAS domain-containing protein [Stellaceae bacterium]